MSTIQVLASVHGSWTSLGAPDAAGPVEATEIPCTATSMEFFDRLYECGMIKHTVLQ